MRPVSQVKQFGVCLHGYTLPINSLYGNINGKEYICTNLFFPKNKQGQKIPYYNILLWNGYRWEDSSTHEHADIRRFMSQFMKREDFIRAKCIWCENKTKVKRREFYQAKRDMASICPKDRVTVIQDCFRYGNQNMIDGRNYDLSAEEKVYFEPFTVGGVPVEYRGSKPVATFTQFDGLLDDTHIDHMKINQVKIRPNTGDKIKDYNGPRYSFTAKDRVQRMSDADLQYWAVNATDKLLKEVEAEISRRG